MDRFHRVSEIWNWLPAFRAVAETEHLPTAAEWLHVTPAALSRTLGLLERSLGQELFSREGRRLRLNSAGQQFLGSIRDAMRRVDDGLQDLGRARFSGPIHLSVAGPFNFAFAAVLEALREEYPEVIPHLHALFPPEINAALLRGELDLAFTPSPVPEAGLAVTRLGSLASHIYCGPGHPLYRARKIDLERILRHAFAAPIPSESSPVADGWPRELEREVGIYVQHLYLALDLCSRGKFLAVFPERVVRAFPGGQKLRRLESGRLEPVPFFAVRRTPLVSDDLADRVIRLGRRHLTSTS